MHNKLSRNDFLKLLSLLPPAFFLPANLTLNYNKDNAPPNIIFLVFDAWSAHNISLYGYPRQTTPNLEKLADNAIVYHNHYAGGHFTIPGTASLLTGTLAWRHAVYHVGYPLAQVYQQNNLFGFFPEYERFSYTHNLLAEDVIRQMQESVDNLKPWFELYYWSSPFQRMFLEDNDVSSVSWIRTMETYESGFANSLFFSRIWSYFTRQSAQELADLYPLGLPKFSASNAFLLEDAIDWLAENV